MASAQGVTTINFGAFPGATDASVVIPTATIGATSQVEAYLYPLQTADHSPDEHIAEMIDIWADPSTIVPGVSFTARGKVRDNPGTGQHYDAKQPATYNQKDGCRLYGLYGLAWAWSDP